MTKYGVALKFPLDPVLANLFMRYYNFLNALQEYEVIF